MHDERDQSLTTHATDQDPLERDLFDELCDQFAACAKPVVRQALARIAATPPADEWNQRTAEELPRLVDPARAGSLTAAIPIMALILRGPVPAADEALVALVAENVARVAVPIWLELLRRGSKSARRRPLTPLLLFDETLPHPLLAAFSVLYLGEASIREVFGAFASQLLSRERAIALPGELEIAHETDELVLRRC